MKCKNKLNTHKNVSTAPKIIAIESSEMVQSVVFSVPR